MNPQDVLLLPVGVGEAFTRKYFTTCMALGVDDHWLLIDCPHPIRRMLHDASQRAGLSLDLDKISAVALSHLHADHASGLEDYLYYSYFALHRRATLVTHAAAASRVWTNMLAGGMDRARIDVGGPLLQMSATDFFDTVLVVDSSASTFGPFTIESRATMHSIPTTAFKITCGGRTLGFSADTPYDPGLIEWLAPCDLIVHEVTTFADSPVHTPYHQLAELPSTLRDKMRLVHYPDDFDAEHSSIRILKEGELVRL